MTRERRFEPRHSANEPVEISWLDQNGAVETARGLLRDLSRSGARIQVDRAIRVGTALQITVREYKLSARVLYCVRTPSDFLLGVELDPDSQGVVRTRQLS